MINSKKAGFTVIEVLVLVVFLTACGVILTLQRNDIGARNRDSHRKTAINAIYFSLEEVFYQQNKYYPETISDQNIKAIDPELFTDPTGAVLGEENSNYRYEATDCQDGKCKKYTLRANLEKEDDFIKRSRNN